MLDDGRVLTFGTITAVVTAALLDGPRRKAGSPNHASRSRRIIRDPDRARRIAYLLRNSELGDKSYCEVEDFLWSIGYNEFLKVEEIVQQQVRHLNRRT